MAGTSAASESVRLGRWTGPTFWALAGGLSMGISLLTIGGFGLVVIPIVILHQLYLRAGPSSRPPMRSRSWSRRLDWRLGMGWIHVLLALATAMLLALPWQLWMLHTYGLETLSGLESPSWGLFGDRPSLASQLFDPARHVAPGLLWPGTLHPFGLDRRGQYSRVGGGIALVIWLTVAADIRCSGPGDRNQPWIFS